MKQRAPFIVTADTGNKDAEQFDASTLKEANAKAAEWIAEGKQNVGISQLTRFAKHQYEYAAIPLPRKVQDHA